MHRLRGPGGGGGGGSPAFQCIAASPPPPIHSCWAGGPGTNRAGPAVGRRAGVVTVGYCRCRVRNGSSCSTSPNLFLNGAIIASCTLANSVGKLQFFGQIWRNVLLETGHRGKSLGSKQAVSMNKGVVEKHNNQKNTTGAGNVYFSQDPYFGGCVALLWRYSPRGCFRTAHAQPRHSANHYVVYPANTPAKPPT